MENTESRLEGILLRFWDWAGYDAACFTKDEIHCSLGKEPFFFPEIGELRKLCYALETDICSEREIEDYLTCMALDNEVEEILDHCADHAPDAFVERIADAALNHAQYEARWQVAELLGRRNVALRETFLNRLAQDSHPYVRRRADNVLKRIV